MAIITFVAGTFSLYRQTGYQFITVDALNSSKSIKFYYTNGFCPQTNKNICSETHRMYRIL